MILYINGDSHAAAAEAVNPHAWAEDDGNLWGQGCGPHPDNEAVSFGAVLSKQLNMPRINQSQAGGSNPRILRTTREWLKQNSGQPVFVLIQWSTWEREEWLHQGTWYQVNASGVDLVPPELNTRYRQYIIDVDWVKYTRQAHEEIWQFHLELQQQGIPHLFFNGNSHFGGTHEHNKLNVPIIEQQYDWGGAYIDPYTVEKTYNKVLLNNGFTTVNPNSYHFGADAHRFWANYVLQYMQDNHFVIGNEISTD